MVVLDSFLVEIVAIGFHMVAFLVVASHLVQPLAVAVHTYAAMVVSDNLLVDFCRSTKEINTLETHCSCEMEIKYQMAKCTNLFS